MSLFPIVTERLLLREFRFEDATAINLYAGDPEVTRHTSWDTSPEHVTSAILKAWIDDQENWPRKSIPLGIELRSDASFIGSTGLAFIDSESSTGLFGFGLKREYWGQGYATEAVRGLLDFAFATLHLHRMTAECFTENASSVRVLEKAGMRREGHFIQNQGRLMYERQLSLCCSCGRMKAFNGVARCFVFEYNYSKILCADVSPVRHRYPVS